MAVAHWAKAGILFHYLKKRSTAERERGDFMVGHISFLNIQNHLEITCVRYVVFKISETEIWFKIVPQEII